VIRRLVTVSGHVQGVFFRETTRRMAEAHAVSGWVRNTAEGTVEAAFEGAPDAVETVIEFCRTGPEGAKVAAVEVRERQLEHAQGFRVL